MNLTAKVTRVLTWTVALVVAIVASALGPTEARADTCPAVITGVFDGQGRTCTNRVTVAGGATLRNVAFDGADAKGPFIRVQAGATLDRVALRRVRHINVQVEGSNVRILDSHFDGTASGDHDGYDPFDVGLWSGGGVSGLVVERSTFVNYRHNAIWADAHDATYRDNRFDNNHRQIGDGKTTYGGGQLGAANGPRNVLIEGNTITGGRGATSGMELGSGGNMVVRNNRVEGQQGVGGIVVQGGTGVIVRDNRLCGNRVQVAVVGGARNVQQVDNPTCDGTRPARAPESPARPTSTPSPPTANRATLQVGDDDVIAWDTGTGRLGQVYASLNGGPERLVTAGHRFRLPIGQFLTEKGTYEFRLYDGATRQHRLATTTVRRDGGSGVSTAARPQPAPTPSPPAANRAILQVGDDNVITWDTATGRLGQVYASLNGGPERLVTAGHRFRLPIGQFLAEKGTYEFRLYDGATRQHRLATATVRR